MAAEALDADKEAMESYFQGDALLLHAYELPSYTCIRYSF
jgi:hypothetical protein